MMPYLAVADNFEEISGSLTMKRSDKGACSRLSYRRVVRRWLLGSGVGVIKMSRREQIYMQRRR